MAESENLPESVSSIIGHKFGRLRVLRFLQWIRYPSGPKTALFECECQCGNVIKALRTNLVRGHTQSCGCYRQDRNSEVHFVHGHARKDNKTILYTAWRNMLQRCNDQNCKSWEHYGKRGVKVIWKTFQEFVRDMADTWEKGMTIERKDFTGNYEKSNCEWIPKRLQKRNTSKTRFLEFQGERQAMVTWAERYGLKQRTLRMRLEYGWSVERALTTPIRRHK